MSEKGGRNRAPRSPRLRQRLVRPCRKAAQIDAIRRFYRRSAGISRAYKKGELRHALVRFGLRA
jgi:hypothetical protein